MAVPLIESSTRHSVYLERLKSGEVNRFAAFLGQMDKSIRDRLANDDLTEFSRTRLEKLLRKVDADLKSIFSDHYDELKGNLIDLASYESEFEARSIANALPDDVPFETVIPAAEQVLSAVFSSPLGVKGPDGGSLLEPFLKNWSAGERRRITGAIRQGFFEGQTNQQIIRAIRGSKAKNYADGILGMTSRSAEAVVRTGVAHAAQTARMETMQANADLLKGYRWVATLDGRTSDQCRSLDGEVFPLDKGPRPPIHIRCRSSMAPELIDKYQPLTKGATRASKDGPVSAKETYYGWLKKQPREFIEDTIGKERANLLLNGGLSAEQFAKLNLGRNFKPLTLAQMREREPLAFAKADAAAEKLRIARNPPRTRRAPAPPPKTAAERAERRAQRWAEARDYTVTNGGRDRVEYAMAVDGDGNILLQKKGEERSVGFTQREFQKLRKSDGTVLFHNHPSNSSLSGADLEMAAAADLEVVAFGTSEASEYAAKVLVSESRIKSGIIAVDDFLFPKISRLVQRFELNEKMAGHLHNHLRNVALDRRGFIDYQFKQVSAATQLALDEVGDSVEIWLEEWDGLFID